MVSVVRRFVTELSVRYGETDRMGVAHHASYLLWFELGRTGLLKEAGYAYRDMEQRGFLLPVLEYTCKLFVGAEYDDTVRIETVIEELKSRTLTFSYRAFRGEKLLAAARTKHMCVDRNNRFRRIPPEIAGAIAPYIVSP
jgi:acyl-CoA thioester hydrolase